MRTTGVTLKVSDSGAQASASCHPETPLPQGMGSWASLGFFAGSRARAVRTRSRERRGVLQALRGHRYRNCPPCAHRTGVRDSAPSQRAWWQPQGQRLLPQWSSPHVGKTRPQQGLELEVLGVGQRPGSGGSIFSQSLASFSSLAECHFLSPCLEARLGEGGNGDSLPF
jgi:hypothetical protein